MSKPLKGFITYAHKKAAAKDELITRLDVIQQRNELVTWHDAEMIGGDKWRENIFKHLADSDIFLYLVSAASLASENCNKELAEAVSSDIRIIPIILEDCDWQHHQLSDFQAFPDRGKPINEWQPESKGWQNVVAGIRKVVDKMQATVQKESLPEWIFQQGNFLLMLGQTDKAIEAYSHAIELNPDNASTYNNHGVAYTKKGEFDKAIVSYTKAIDLNPDFALAYTNRGAVYAVKGDYDRAIVDLTKAIELNTGDANAYHNRGAAYGVRGKADLALADFSKVIELNPDDAVAYNNRGVAYYLKKEYESAIVDFTRAIELNPDYAIAYNNRGRTYGVKGEVDGLTPRPDSPTSKRAVIRAIKDYNPAIGLNPKLAPAYYNRGVAWLRLREWERAKSDLTVAREMGINIITEFRNDYDSVESFERRNGVQLPEDIAAMLL